MIKIKDLIRFLTVIIGEIACETHGFIALVWPITPCSAYRLKRAPSSRSQRQDPAGSLPDEACLPIVSMSNAHCIGILYEGPAYRPFDPITSQSAVANYGGLHSCSSTAPSNTATVSIELCLPVVPRPNRRRRMQDGPTQRLRTPSSSPVRATQIHRAPSVTGVGTA